MNEKISITEEKVTAKKYYFYKYWPILILLCSIIISLILYINKVDIKCLENMMVADIIIALMPLVFTIITLSLSFSRETIYGQPISQIRKIRKDKHFKFKEMIGLNISIFILLTIFEILSLTIQVWALDIVSAIYCILFCHQEVPILTKSNSSIKKIIKKSGYLDELSKFSDYFDGATSDGKITFDIIQAILLSDGIVSAYNSFKTKKFGKNIILLDNLLSLQNSFLFKCIENKKYLSAASISLYKGIDILQATEMAFSNLDSCILSKKDFNYIDIVKSSKSYYQITRSIFSLHSLMNEIKLEDKFKSRLVGLLHSCFIKISLGNPTDDEKKFVYRILNNMIVHTISKKETWFIEAVRDSGFESKFISYSLDYFYFITMYLFYVSNIEKKASNEIKENIIRFILEDCNGLNSEKGDNIMSIFNYNWNSKEFDEMANLLPNLLTIFNSCEEYFIWFQPLKMRSWSSDDGGFDKRFIIKNWFILLLASSVFLDFKYETIESIFENLRVEDKKILMLTLNDCFISEGKFVTKEADFEYAKFYNAYLYFNEEILNRAPFKQIVAYVQKYNKAEIVENINKNIKTREDFQDYKNLLVSKLNETVKKMDIYDSNVKIDFSKNYCYTFLFTSESSNQFVEGIVKGYKNSIERLVYEEVKKRKFLMKEIKSSNAEKIADLIIRNNYTYCNNSCYLFYVFKVPQNKRDQIYKIQHKSICLPNSCYWKENALKINLVCNEEKTIVRSLTRDEINRKIDEEYSQVDGLYKYSKYQCDNRSIFVSREELIDILSKQYFYACIVFNYKIEIDNKSIISIYKKEEKD